MQLSYYIGEHEVCYEVGMDEQLCRVKWSWISLLLENISLMEIIGSQFTHLNINTDNLNTQSWKTCEVIEQMHPLYGEAINTLRPSQNGRHFPDDIFK